MRITASGAWILACALVLFADDSAGRKWWTHVRRLASDRLQGRATASPGHRQAAEYVAAQFRKAGLSPCDAAAGYFQKVPLIEKRLIEADSSLEVVSGSRTRTLKLGEDAILSTRVEAAAPSVEAQAVFAGYGLTIAERDWNDFAGIDARGKIAVTISGSPAHLPGPLRAHFSSQGEKSRALEAAGAVGSIAIPNPKTSDVPWARTSAARLIPSMSIDGGSAAPRASQFGATLNAARAAWLFEGTGHTLEELLALATAGKPLPRFPLPVTFRARTRIERRQATSENVCALLQGTAAGPQGEAVVLSAHLDHLGISPDGAAQADRIYNGAMDNASGIATLIEVAHALRGAKPNRSLIFVAVTGEEKGLLGSRYFASRPPAGLPRQVAGINFDMFLPLHPMKIVLALGLDESNLRGPLEQAAAGLGLRVQSDPEPQRNRFIRSDQYSFIQRGVPSLALKVGYEAGSAEAELHRQWIATRYHAVSDDLTQPVSLEAAVLFNRLVRDLALAVANLPERPRWKETSFFRRFAEQPDRSLRTEE